MSNIRSVIYTVCLFHIIVFGMEWFITEFKFNTYTIYISNSDILNNKDHSTPAVPAIAEQLPTFFLY